MADLRILRLLAAARAQSKSKKTLEETDWRNVGHRSA